MVAEYRLRVLNLGRELHCSAGADNNKLQLQFSKTAAAVFDKTASAVFSLL
jgi:hypothetical protein